MRQQGREGGGGPGRESIGVRGRGRFSHASNNMNSGVIVSNTNIPVTPAVNSNIEKS